MHFEQNPRVELEFNSAVIQKVGSFCNHDPKRVIKNIKDLAKN